MKNVLILLISFVCFNLAAQSDSLQFLQDFYGIYKGDLHITNARGKQTIQMEFHLNPTDSVGKYEYKLVYVILGKPEERNYALLEKDATKGEYIVDENNGILIDAKLIDNTLYSMFEVGGSILTTTERFYKDSMDFEITFANKSQQTKSGTTGEDATEVISYPISVLQKAHLIKQ